MVRGAERRKGGTQGVSALCAFYFCLMTYTFIYAFIYLTLLFANLLSPQFFFCTMTSMHQATNKLLKKEGKEREVKVQKRERKRKESKGNA